MFSILYDRYRDGYSICGWIIAFGRLIVLAGLCLTVGFYYYLYSNFSTVSRFISDVLIGFPALSHALGNPSVADQVTALVIVIIGVGLFLLIVFEVAGTIVAGLGEMAQAVVDIAVNTSPLLTLEEKETLFSPWWKRLAEWFRRKKEAVR